MSTQIPREFNRYPMVSWGQKVLIKHGKHRLAAEILDESLGGLGLRLTTAVDISTGVEVRVDNGQFARMAKVVFHCPHERGGFRIGLQWTPNSQYELV